MLRWTWEDREEAGGQTECGQNAQIWSERETRQTHVLSGSTPKSDTGMHVPPDHVLSSLRLGFVREQERPDFQRTCGYPDTSFHVASVRQDIMVTEYQLQGTGLVHCPRTEQSPSLVVAAVEEVSEDEHAFGGEFPYNPIQPSERSHILSFR